MPKKRPRATVKSSPKGVYPPQFIGKGLADNPQNRWNGRTPGSKNRSTILRELLAAETVVDGKPVKGLTNEHLVLIALIDKAQSGDVPAIKEVLDIVYGKIPEKSISATIEADKLLEEDPMVQTLVRYVPKEELERAVQIKTANINE